MGEFLEETIQLIQPLKGALRFAASHCFEERWRGWRLMVHPDTVPLKEVLVNPLEPMPRDRGIVRLMKGSGQSVSGLNGVNVGRETVLE